MRGHSGAWCGYVGIGATHPLYDTDSSDVAPWDDRWMERAVDIDEVGAINLFISAFEASRNEIPHGHAPLTSILTCHGGLSFSGRLRTWTGWFFGFDCSHAGDYSPVMAQALQEAGIECDFMHDFETYRNQAYVRNECENLAWQLAQYAAACTFKGA